MNVKLVLTIIFGCLCEPEREGLLVDVTSGSSNSHRILVQPFKTNYA